MNALSHTQPLVVPRDDWEPYFEAIPDHPSTLARLALPLVRGRDKCIDLGCGKMNDTRLMLATGFRKVEAVDSSPRSALYASELARARGGCLRFTPCSFDDYYFGPGYFDWVHSNFALPYDRNFREVIGRIFRRLHFGGIFSATFLGPRDEPYRMHDGFHVIDEPELLRLLSGFSVVDLREYTPLSPFFDGHVKQWHYFRAICIK